MLSISPQEVVKQLEQFSENTFDDFKEIKNSFETAKNDPNSLVPSFNSLRIGEFSFSIYFYPSLCYTKEKNKATEINQP